MVKMAESNQYHPIANADENETKAAVTEVESVSPNGNLDENETKAAGTQDDT
jgi:hypothetical protein